MTMMKHWPCRCGCGELADECARGSDPLAAFAVTPPAPTTLVALFAPEGEDT